MTAGAVSELVLYVRAGCHLCDQFLLDASIDLGLAAEQLQLRDVDADVDTAVRYGLRVPVLEWRGAVLCEGIYDAAGVRQALGV